MVDTDFCGHMIDKKITLKYDNVTHMQVAANLTKYLNFLALKTTVPNLI